METIIDISRRQAFPIFLGFPGENDSRPVSVDAAPWLAEFPDGTVSFVYTRHDKLTYAVVVNQPGPVVTWKPLRADLVEGNCSLQIQIKQGDIVKKTCIIACRVGESLDDPSDPPQPPRPTYVEEVIDAADRADAAAAAAEDAAERAEEAGGDVSPEQLAQAIEDYFAEHPIDVPTDAVLYTEQTLTPAQQEQARGNIGAAGADDVASDFAARDSLMQKCAVVVDSSPNRWNKDAAATGLLGLNGRLYTGGSYDNYCYYNIGSVNEGDVITSYKKQNTAVDSASMMRVVCYDSGGNAVVSAGTSTATQSFTVPSGVASVAICTTKNTGLTYNYMVLVNAESAPIDYIPFSETNSFYVATEDFLPKSMRTDKVNSLLGSDSPTVSAATLASGTALTLEDAPYFIKKNVSVSARMEFETFASVEVGKGQNSYRGKSVIVDSTNITQVSYNDSGTAVNGNSVAHGLTVSDYLQVTMHLGDDGKCAVTVNTTSGTFDTVFDFSAEWNYSPFVVGAQEMTGVRLNYSCSDIRCPMWVFGDSYLGLWDNRVGGQLRQLGFFNFALVGVAGGRANDGSKATYPDLQRMLAFGTPKYIVWTLGMNGGDAANVAFLPTLIKLCEDKDIELILYKVPSIPTIDHTSLNSYIESTGLRYIDGAAAVGADASGNWYADMLSSDGVHPSTIGAKALAMRYLTDCPEIMQYGKIEEYATETWVQGQGYQTAQQVQTAIDATVGDIETLLASI